jgi:predicted nucleic acid-binding protein
VTPGIWRWEIANMLVTCVRRKRLQPEDVSARLAMLATLPITTDPESGGYVWTAVTTLAGGHGLTVYDASYLELALRHALPLATKDSALARVARSLGVPLLLAA